METTATATDLVRRDERAIASALKIRYRPFAADGGKGGRLFDVDGRSYLDFGAAWGLAVLGYSNEGENPLDFDGFLHAVDSSRPCPCPLVDALAGRLSQH